MKDIYRIQSYDVVIIGAGVMGLSTAFQLRNTGKRILLLDQLPIPNNINASWDYTRSFRVHYGDDEYYTLQALESYKLWKEQEQYANRQFLHASGKLLLGESEEDYAYTCYETLKWLNLPVKLMDKRDIRRQFPQFKSNFAVLDQVGSVIDANRYMRFLLDAAMESDIKLRGNTTVKAIDGNRLTLDNGDRIIAERIVVTVGAWLSNLVDMPVLPTRQQSLYLQPNDPKEFQLSKFPVFSFMDKGYYGIPMFDGKAVKVSNHIPGETGDPLKDNKVIAGEFQVKIHAFLQEYIPSLANAKIVDSTVKYYTMTADRGFILEELGEHLIVAGGFSGHGFKFSPLIGRIVSDLVITGTTKYDISRWHSSRLSGDISVPALAGGIAL